MKTICPYCGYKATNHETIDGDKIPKEGDSSFCIRCGEDSIFKNNKLEKVNLKDLDDEQKKEIIRIKNFWLKTKNSKLNNTGGKK